MPIRAALAAATALAALAPLAGTAATVSAPRVTVDFDAVVEDRGGFDPGPLLPDFTAVSGTLSFGVERTPLGNLPGQPVRVGPVSGEVTIGERRTRFTGLSDRGIIQSRGGTTIVGFAVEPLAGLTEIGPGEISRINVGFAAPSEPAFGSVADLLFARDLTVTRINVIAEIPVQNGLAFSNSIDDAPTVSVSPVPLPASLGLLAGALAVLAAPGGLVGRRAA